MSGIDESTVDALRRAVWDCADRGLHYASKWAAELLLAIPAERRRRPRGSTARQAASTAGETLDTAKAVGAEESSNLVLRTNVPVLVSPEEAALLDEEADTLACARTMADAKEFLRASALLADCHSARARFMRWYFDFLAEEKRALRDWHNLDYSLAQNAKASQVPLQPVRPINKGIQELLEMVVDEEDPWLLFLKALFLKRLSRREETIEACIRSISRYPWNWSTWMLLADCIGDRDELGAIIPLIPLRADHPLMEFFKLKVIVDLTSPVDEDLPVIDNMLKPDYFPNSAWLMSMRAALLYHLHDFHRAEAQFDALMKLDPLRLDDIDILSNILYVAENRVKLSKLAHHFLTVDRDRPEYFRRATELNQAYLPAWTLMGHEYVEIKNAHAAIESYRRAIDVNRKDYRAWYGLGQAYELLNMHQYSLYYYQRSTALKPYDVRIWQALGMCYEEMGRPREAIECHKRALLGADPSDTALCLRLAKLYDEIEDYRSAASYHQGIIDISIRENRQTYQFSKSLIYVARYHLDRGGGDLPRARAYAERVAQSNAEDVQAATELVRRLHALGVTSPSTTPSAGTGTEAGIVQLAQSSAPLADVGTSAGTGSSTSSTYMTNPEVGNIPPRFRKISHVPGSRRPPPPPG